jgi:hypothetical protein
MVYQLKTTLERNSMKSRNILLALPCALLSLSAMAAGNHAGSHGESTIGKPGAVDLPPPAVPTQLRKSGIARLIDLRSG